MTDRIRVYESEGQPYCIREQETDHGYDVLDDSQKVWWPFAVDDISLEEAAELCREHYPEDDVQIVD